MSTAKTELKSFEKLGVFYIGKEVDPSSGEIGEHLLYDSSDLTTHAVCVGMTGSGKTGLCISVLEEAAIDSIPAIIIDPKGDLGNLLLTFPDFKGEDYLPWINPDEARKKNLSEKEYADKQAALWKNGLADWDQDGDRIKRLRNASDFTIYTPGSTSGIPVSIVDSLAAPKGQKMEDLDLLRERIQTTVSGLLALLGIDADPLQSREHILLANIVEHAWSSGTDLQLGDLIRLIQSPPIEQIGVFNIEDFFPSSARMKLAMTLNNLLAAPGFKTWMDGTPLDIDQILYSSEGKPCTAIFSIAHLSDSERMFFVTLLLNQVIGWMRTRTGSTSLRALLYMDEVFGFLPPVSEPPSKKPLLTLLKQARAFGIGVILSTQNPVDLDYKGLSNAGTWFIGRLQTEKDKERLVDGLIRGDAGDVFDKKTLMSTISSLKKRQFLLHNVHEKKPSLFNTRWVLSYLCGPLSRKQISLLMQGRQTEQQATIKKKKEVTPRDKAVTTQPQLPPAIRQHTAEIDRLNEPDKTINYIPHLIAVADISIFNNRYGVMNTQTVAYALPVSKETSTLSWQSARAIEFDNRRLTGTAGENATYAPLANAATRLATFEQLDKRFETFLYQTFKLKLLRNRALKLISQPGESQRDFKIRLQDAAHERRDLEKQRIKRSFEKKVRPLEKKIQAAENVIGRESDQYQQRMMDTAISVGSTLLGAFLGGRSSRSGVTRAARSASRLRKEKQDISRAREKMTVLENEIRELEKQFDEQIAELAQKYESIINNLEELNISPKKSDILQKFFAVVWIPYSEENQVLSSLIYTSNKS